MGNVLLLGKNTSPLGQGLRILTTSLPSATVGVSYLAQLQATGGSPLSGGTYLWSIDSCTPHDALWIQCVGQSLTGTPQMTETETIVVRVTDLVGASVTATFTIVVRVTGSLSIVSLSNGGTAYVGGAYSYQILASGGQPPYSWSSGAIQQPWNLTWNGWLNGTPTATGSPTFPVTVTDVNGASVSQTVSVSVVNGLQLAGVDSTQGRIALSGAYAGQPFQQQLYAYGGTNPYQFSATQLPSWATVSPSGVVSGTPTSAGNVTIQLQVQDAASNSYNAVGLLQVGPSGKVSRPAYNSPSSHGFFILNGQLYDPNGYPFRIRGLDRNHYDSSPWGSNTNGALTNANAVRVFMFDGQTAAFALNQCNTQYLSAAVGGTSGNYILPILTFAGIGAAPTQGNTSTSFLAQVASDWLSYEPTLAGLNGNFIVNPANEWGPARSINWQYAYQYVSGSITNISGTTITINTISASNPFANCPFALIWQASGITNQVVNLSSPGGVSGAWTVQSSVSLAGYSGAGTLYGGMVGVLRGCGYTSPILIDSGQSGQDPINLLTYAQTIQSSDPLQNCLFALHAYNCVCNAQCSISAITNANPAVITLNSNNPYHPMSGVAANSPTWPIPGSSGNNFVLAYNISGVAGMTQINGQATCSNGNMGGSQGSWTVTLSGVDSTGYGVYTSGGTIIPASNGGTFNPVVHYNYMAQQLSALRSSNVCVGFFEFGPGNAWGARSTAFTGSCSGTTLTVSAMLCGVIQTNSIGINGYGGMVLRNTSGSLGVTVLSQLTGTLGGVGTYQLSGAATSSSGTHYFQNPSGQWGTMLDSDPTSTYLGQMICAAEAYQMNWCYWALDDHNIGANQACSWIGWFGMENANTNFGVPSDLTAAGIDVTFNPRYGTRTLASPPASLLAPIQILAPNLVYQGSFRVPYSPGQTNQTLGNNSALGMCFSPPNGANGTQGSLYITGSYGANIGYMCEIQVPAPSNWLNGYNNAISSLFQTTFLQTFSDATNGTITQVDSGGQIDVLLGALVYNGKLIVGAGANVYSVGNPSALATHWSRPLTLSTSGQTVGPKPVGAAANTTQLYAVHGSLCDIPTEWQSPLGGPCLAMQMIPNGPRSAGSLSGTQNHGAGPAASSFDPANIGVVSPVPATPLMQFGLAGNNCLGWPTLGLGWYHGAGTGNPVGQLNPWSSLFNVGAEAGNASVFPSGWNTLLILGSKNCHSFNNLYGPGTTTHPEWDGLPAFLNFTGTVGSGSTTITVTSVSGGILEAGAQYAVTGPGIPANTHVTTFTGPQNNPATITISQASTGGSGSYNVSGPSGVAASTFRIAYEGSGTIGSGEGYHGWPRCPWALAFKASDLQAVKNGTLAANAIMPYATFPLPVPYFSMGSGADAISACGWDSTNGYLYLAHMNADVQGGSSYPLIHVYKIQATSLAPLTITTTSLPNATHGVAYSGQINVTGGTPPYSYGIAWCSALGVPQSNGATSWATINSNGQIVGTPPTAETEYPVVYVTDSSPTKQMAVAAPTLVIT